MKTDTDKVNGETNGVCCIKALQLDTPRRQK
jgi:hypothetical protein